MRDLTRTKTDFKLRSEIKLLLLLLLTEATD